MIGQLSQEVYEYLDEHDQMNWSFRGNVLNQYLRNTSIGMIVMVYRYAKAMQGLYTHLIK